MESLASNARLYNRIALLVVGAIVILAIINPLVARRGFSDQSYHLMVAQQFNQAGGVVAHDFWESLPEGRPHIYPPLFHLILSIPVTLRIEPFTIIVWTSVLVIILFFGLLWTGLRLLWNEQIASLAVIIVSCHTQFISMIATTTPSLLVLAATPLLLYFWQRKTWPAFTLLLALMMYTHLYMPWIIVVTLIVWIIASTNRHTFLPTVRSISCAVIIYLPWLLHVLASYTAIKYFNASDNLVHITNTFGIHLFFAIGFMVAAVYALKQWPKYKTNPVYFYIILLILCSPIIVSSYPERYWENIFIFGSAIIIAWAIQQMNDRIKTLCVFIVVSMVFIAPSALITTDQKPVGFIIKWATTPNAFNQWRAGEASFSRIYLDHYTRPIINLARIINKQSAPNQPIYALATRLGLSVFPEYDRFQIGQLFGALANRPMINLRQPEYFYRPEPDITNASIIIVNAVQLEKDPALRAQIAASFNLIGDQAEFQVYKNKNTATIQAHIPSLVFPRWLALILILTAVVYITRTTRQLMAQ